jgi:hypothetical protein
MLGLGRASLYRILDIFEEGGFHEYDIRCL